MSSSLRRTIQLAIFLPILLMAAVCALLGWQAHRLSALNGWVEHTGEVIAQAHSVERLALDEEINLSGFGLTGDRVFLERSGRDHQLLAPAVAELRTLTADNPAQQERIGRLAARLDQWSATKGPAHRAAMDEIRNGVGGLLNEENRLLAVRRNDFETGTRQLAIGGSLLLLALGGFLAWLLRRLVDDVDRNYRQAFTDLEHAHLETAEMAAIVLHSTDAIIATGLDGVIRHWNPAATALFSFSSEDAVGKNISFLVPADGQLDMLDCLRRVRLGKVVEPFETSLAANGGEPIAVHISIAPVRDPSGAIRGASVSARDIRERIKTDEQMREMQKLESLGLIAGGVAHDFNNLLVGILGNASLVLDEMDPSDHNRELLGSVVQASERAASLTQQMLAYAGKGRFVTGKIDLSRLVREIVGLVQLSIPRTVELRLELSDNLPPVEADAGQIQQLVMNLVINGAEAIGDNPGTVFLGTDYQELDDAYMQMNFAGEKVGAGPYVVLEVQDTGSGMDENTRRKIFDPFFTTKFAGRGLGLAAALGIIRGHKGTIRVYSVPGIGTTFKVLLPAAPGTATIPATEIATDLRGSGKVLIVDDEPVVRSTAKKALERYGYSVVTANNGLEGLDAFRTHDGFAAVLLDMTMPLMDGPETLRGIIAHRPNARIVMTSGYNEAEAIRRLSATGVAAFIQKPYTAEKLARVMKRVTG